MRTTSGQNWLQVMRTHAAQPGEGPAADVQAPSPVPQLRVAGLPGQNMVSPQLDWMQCPVPLTASVNGTTPCCLVSINATILLHSWIPAFINTV